MAKINIPKLNKTIEADDQLPLMHTLMEDHVPVASSCGGDGICGKCLVTVISGHDNLTPKNPQEVQTLEKIKALEDERLSCQSHVKGDIKIATTYW